MYFIFVETKQDLSHYTVHEKHGTNANIFLSIKQYYESD